MPAVRIMVSPPFGQEFQHEPFHLHPEEFEFSRVPCVDEIVSLGNDEEGVAADYKVLIVHHAQTDATPVEAELYAVRVAISDVIR